MNTDQQKHVWERYIKELFTDDRPQKYPVVEMDHNIPILTTEVEHAIEETENYKFSGEDATTAVLFKHLGENAIKKLTCFLNTVYETIILSED